MYVHNFDEKAANHNFITKQIKEKESTAHFVETLH